MTTTTTDYPILAAFARRDSALHSEQQAARDIVLATLYSPARIEVGAFATLDRAAFGGTPVHALDFQRVRRIAARAGVA